MRQRAAEGVAWFANRERTLPARVFLSRTLPEQGRQDPEQNPPCERDYVRYDWFPLGFSHDSLLEMGDICAQQGARGIRTRDSLPGAETESPRPALTLLIFRRHAAYPTCTIRFPMSVAGICASSILPRLARSTLSDS